MAFPTAVNSQITDAVTQSHVQVVAAAPAQALGVLYQAVAHATALAMQNAVAQQQSLNQLSTAVTAKAVNLLLSVDTSHVGS
jgi:hypothetical protein